MKMFAFKRIARLLAALGGLAGGLSLAACATPQPVAREATIAAPRPGLWKVADADTTIYLFGTIHILPKDLQWRTPALERAIARSDELVLETRLGTDLAATGRTLAKMGIAEGQPPLIERVPEERRERLAAMIAGSGIPARAFDRMDTWAAALTLTAAAFRNMGFSPEAGVEKSIEGAYAGKRISGLETVEQQFGFFDTLSEEGQRSFLTGAVEDPAKSKADFQAMLAAWAAGDTDAIARTFDAETAFSPELREVLITRRNAAWADWIETRLDQPGTVMVAVGAGHLAGRDSVQRMLAEKGLKAERVQ